MSLFCEMIKNEEQEDRNSSFQGFQRWLCNKIPAVFPACRSCEALDLWLASHTLITSTVLDFQIYDQYILEWGKGEEWIWLDGSHILEVLVKIWAGDLHGRLQWRSIVMGFVHWTCMPKCHTHRTQIFSPTCERKTINWMQSIVLWFANWTWMSKCCTSHRR